MLVEDIRLAAQLLAAFAAAVAATCAAWNVWNLRATANATLLLALLKDYRSEDFRNAINHLRQFRVASARSEGFAVDCAERILRAGGDADELDRARRLLSHFFISIKALCEGRMLARGLVANTFGRAAFEFFLEVVEPIDREYARRAYPGRYEDVRPFFEGLVSLD